MSAILGREWRALCRSLTGYLCLAIFALVAGVFTTVYNIHFGFSELEYSLYYLGMALSLVIPPVAVKLFGASRDGEDDRLLRMLPVSRKDVFFGKYLAGVSAIGALTLLLGVLPLVFGLFADVNYGSAYVALLLFFLLGNAVFAICAFLVSAIRPRAAVWCIGYGVVGLLIALCCIAQILPMPWRNMVAAVSLFGAYLPTVLALLEWKTVLLYGTVIAVFGALCAVSFLGKWSQRIGTKKPRLAPILSVVLGVAILMNTGMLFVPVSATRADLTQTDTYTLSEGSRDFLKNLDTEVTVFVIEGTGGDTRFEYFMDELCGQSKKLSWKRLSAADSGDILAPLGLTPGDITGSGLPYYLVIQGQTRTEGVDYYSLFYYYTANSNLLQFLQTYFSASAQAKMSYYEYNQYLYYLELYSQQNSQFQQYWYYLVNDTDRYFQGEAVLTSVIEYVSADLIPVTYRLVGNGENELSGTLMSSLLSTYSLEYKALNLKEIEAIPDDAAAVLVAAPTADYSVEDTAKLEAYLARGGVVSVLTEETHLDYPNLMGLLRQYGLSADKGLVGKMVEVVADEESADSSEGESAEEGKDSAEAQTVTEPSYTVDVAPNAAHPSMAGVAGQSGFAPAVTNACPITLHTDSGKELTALMTTSVEAFVGEVYDQKAARTVAAVSEDAQTGASLFWFTGAGSYLVPVTAYKDYQLYNDFCLHLAMSSTDLVYRSVLTPPEATIYEVSYMTVSKTAAIIYGVLTIVLLPAVAIAAGVIGRYRRKKA